MFVTRYRAGQSGPMAKVLLVFVALSVGGVVFVNNATGRITEPDRSYAEEISRTYDFKFGSNPFAPGNATTTNGTFIPGDQFVLAKRCGTCHTDAHAQWRQSAHGNASLRTATPSASRSIRRTLKICNRRRELNSLVTANHATTRRRFFPARSPRTHTSNAHSMMTVCPASLATRFSRSMAVASAAT